MQNRQSEIVFSKMKSVAIIFVLKKHSTWLDKTKGDYAKNDLKNPVTTLHFVLFPNFLFGKKWFYWKGTTLQILKMNFFRTSFFFMKFKKKLIKKKKKATEYSSIWELPILLPNCIAQLNTTLPYINC